jgi:DNA processing protein
MPISDAGRKCLRLHLAEGVGPIQFKKVLERFGSIDRALGASADELTRVNGFGPQSARKAAASRDAADVDQEASLADRHGVSIHCILDEDYPEILRHLPDPPPILYVKGRYLPEDALAIAIVGARRCTHYGREQANRFAGILAEAGLAIVSGMAYGADTAAHRGCLIAGGRTIAVLGCGLSQVYPPENAELAERIVEHGALISELPMSAQPLARHFPKRNRIIVGLSLGVLVVEAAARSGALITGRLASEYNREVFAVPGRLDNPYAVGVNSLIRDGHAKLAMDLDDILGELGEVGRSLTGKATRKGDEAVESTSLPDLTDDERRVREALDGSSKTPDDLAEEAGLAPQTVLQVLISLQLKGLAEQTPGMRFRGKINA